jgi:hypothetical protein
MVPVSTDILVSSDTLPFTKFELAAAASPLLLRTILAFLGKKKDKMLLSHQLVEQIFEIFKQLKVFKIFGSYLTTFRFKLPVFSFDVPFSKTIK